MKIKCFFLPVNTPDRWYLLCYFSWDTVPGVCDSLQNQLNLRFCLHWNERPKNSIKKRMNISSKKKIKHEFIEYIAWILCILCLHTHANSTHQIGKRVEPVYRQRESYECKQFVWYNAQSTQRKKNTLIHSYENEAITVALLWMVRYQLRFKRVK